MITTIRSKIVKIGNSHGIRIPQAVLQQLGLKDEVELKVDGNQLIVEALNHPRNDWEVSFAEMAKNRDDLLLEQGTTPKWDEEEWSW